MQPWERGKAHHANPIIEYVNKFFQTFRAQAHLDEFSIARRRKGVITIAERLRNPPPPNLPDPLPACMYARNNVIRASLLVRHAHSRRITYAR